MGSEMCIRDRRYTEARLTHLGHALMTDMDKATVDWVPNYDETRQEPTVFPAAFPNLLINGGTGIAVGMATSIPPHNLGEIVDGICAQVDDPDITIEGLMKHIKGPDFRPAVWRWGWIRSVTISRPAGAALSSAAASALSSSRATASRSSLRRFLTWSTVPLSLIHI